MIATITPLMERWNQTSTTDMQLSYVPLIHTVPHTITLLPLLHHHCAHIMYFDLLEARIKFCARFSLNSGRMSKHGKRSKQTPGELSTVTAWVSEAWEIFEPAIGGLRGAVLAARWRRKTRFLGSILLANVSVLAG